MSFLDDFLSNREVRKDPSSKYCIESNKWDRQTKDEVEEQVKDYILATDELTNKVSTGYEAMSDTLLTLFKASPKLRNQTDIRPSYLINHKVMQEMFELSELQDARRTSVGDPVATGLSAARLEPELEIIFDKMQKAQELAQDIEQLLETAGEQADRLEEIMEALSAESTDTPAVDWQEQAARIQESLDAIREQIENSQSGLEQELENQTPFVRESLTEALKEINKENESLNEFESWGLSPGSIRRLNPKPRMELAKKLQTRQFKKMTEVIGRMQNVAFSSQVEQSDYSMEEVYELEQGNDLARLVPTELLALNHDLLVYDFLHRFMERSLTQYALQGNDTVNRGSIIALMDSSSSMHGERVIWSKAISLALLKIAKMQNRKFTAIEFAGPGMFIEYAFDTSQDELMLRRSRGGRTNYSYGAEAIVEFAEDGLSGGTCFMTPLSRALDLLIDEHSATGRVSADIVFLTDGQAGVDRTFMERFKDEQERLGFKVFGIAVGGSTSSEPLRTICDGQVTNVKTLTATDEAMKPIFGAMGT